MSGELLETIRKKTVAIGRFFHNLQIYALVSTAGLLLMANAIVVALGLVRTPLMTWILPRDEVGMIGVVAAWFPFVQLLSLTGLDAAAYHYASKGVSDAFRVNLYYRLRWSLLSAGIFFLGAVFWFARGDQLLVWMFLLAGLTFPVTAGLSACAGLLSAEQRYKSLFWYRLFESLTDFSGFIPLVFSTWLLSKVVTFYATNQFATAAMQVGVSLALIARLNKTATPPMPQDDRSAMVRYGKNLTGVSTISVFQTRMDGFLVGLFLPLGTMADYSIALLVYDQFKRLWNIYITSRYPNLVQMPFQRRKRRFIREGILVWVGFVLAAVVIALIGHWLIPILLPPAYRSSLGYMDLLIAAFLIGFPGNIFELFFRSCQDEKSQYIIRGCAAVSGLIATLLLIRPLGNYGPAIGRMVSNLVFSAAGGAIFLTASNQR